MKLVRGPDAHPQMVFAITGMSECGKSTVGRYLNEKGVLRLKIIFLKGDGTR